MLSDAELREFVERGYLVLPGVVPPPQRDAALRQLNISLGGGRRAQLQGPGFTGHENCDPAQHAPEVLGLLTDTPAFAIAEQLTEHGGLTRPTCCQVRLMFPTDDPDVEPADPHLDGIPRKGNPLPPGQISPFSLLVGVFLSDLPSAGFGNLALWPGSHRLLGDHVRKHPAGWLDDEGYGPPKRGPQLPIPLGEPDVITANGGDVVVAHYQVGHAVTPNTSPHIRYVVYFRLAHRDLRRDWSQLVDLWRCHPALAHVLATPSSA